MVPIITTQCFTLWCMQNRDESVAKSSYKTKHVCVMAAGWVGGRMVWDGAIKQRWKGAEQGTLARRWSTVRLRLQRRGNQLNTLLEEFLALVSLWFLKDSTTFTLEVSFFTYVEPWKKDVSLPLEEHFGERLLFFFKTQCLYELCW